MDEQTHDIRLATPGEEGEQVLAQARDALAEARDALLAEREAQADLRDAAADRRDRATDAREQSADERDVALRAREAAADERDRVADARNHAAAVRAQRHRDDLRLDERDRDEADIERLWAGTDRDAAAIDRAALRDVTLRDPAQEE